MPRRFEPSRAELTAKGSTDAEELRGLGTHRSSFVRSAVAKNSHTPPDVLGELAASGDRFTASAVAGNPSTPADVLVRLATGADDFTAKALAGNTATPASLLPDLAQHESQQVRREVAWSDACTPEVLDLLSRDPASSVRAAVARRPGTPDAAVLRLAHDRSAEVAEALCKRNVPADRPVRVVHRRQFTGTHHVMREFHVPIEQGGRFSAEVMRAFAAGRHESLYKLAAAQPDAPEDVLDALARHANEWIRVRVAENPGASESVLLGLARSRDSRVLKALAGRAEIPESVLIEIVLSRATTAHDALSSSFGPVLARHEAPAVRRAATKILAAEETEVWLALLDDEVTQVRTHAAMALPSEMLDGLMEHPAPQVRQQVAARTEEPEVLRTLSGDVNAAVRRRVVDNPQCPEDVIALLATDRDVRVCRLAGERLLRALGN